MNSLNQIDLQDWELLLPQDESVLDSNKSLEIPKQDKPDEKSSGADSIKVDESDDDDDDRVKLNTRKWSLNGIGTICSVGVAAASVCIIILGNHKKNKLRFHIYTNDKFKGLQRIKNQHSKKLDEAISALGSAIITKARLTIGGYYDSTL
ncbi:hypothetical protein CASFOL_024602 [Castilleja foliolosa]|uniref:DUF6821 domain-containing protein n=1 Tax=Castilleja foliolosa TaxID=1961234 RepID=A0ABD3CNU0_9LAMI